MDWELVRPFSGVILSKIGVHKAYTFGHGRDVLGLRLGFVRAEYPMGEIPQLAATFFKQFLDVRGDFPPEFRATGWVHSIDKNWWGRMVGFSLTKFEDLLLQAGLYGAIKAIQYGIPQSI